MKWIQTRGRLVYEPNRGEFNKQHKVRTLIADLPRDDLDLYYQWMLRKERGSWFSLAAEMQEVFNTDSTGEPKSTKRQITVTVPGVSRPMFGKHVTIVRGDERGFKSPEWRKHAGRVVPIEYSPELDFTYGFWSLPVKPTDELRALRAELGLTPNHNFHITIARQQDWTR